MPGNPTTLAVARYQQSQSLVIYALLKSLDLHSAKFLAAVQTTIDVAAVALFEDRIGQVGMEERVNVADHGFAVHAEMPHQLLLRPASALQSWGNNNKRYPNLLVRRVLVDFIFRVSERGLPVNIQSSSQPLTASSLTSPLP